MKVKAIFTDFDGTIFVDNQISSVDLKALREIKNRGIRFVIATGRSIFSLKRALGDDWLADYIICSSGAGIIDTDSRKFIYKRYISRKNAILAAKVLKKAEIDFMVHELIPENHKFLYFQRKKSNPDFKRRIALYEDHALPLTDFNKIKDATQLLGIIGNDKKKYDKIKEQLPHLKVIRTTSPLDGHHIWIEIFPKDVSKGHAAKWLSEKMGISQKETLGLGNDFNDIDLLRWTERSYVVPKAPKELTEKYAVLKVKDKNTLTNLLKILNCYL